MPAFPTLHRFVRMKDGHTMEVSVVTKFYMSFTYYLESYLAFILYSEKQDIK